MESVIRNTLHLDHDHPITLDDLFKYTLEIDIHTLELDNVTGTKLMIHEELQHQVLSLIKRYYRNGEDYSGLLIPEIADFFEIQTPAEARFSYAGIAEEDEALKIMNRELDGRFAQFEKAWKKSDLLQKNIDLKTLKKKLQGLINVDLLPERLTAKNSAHQLGSTHEVELSQEQAVDQQVELTKEVVSENTGASRRFWRHLPWENKPPQHNTSSTRGVRLQVYQMAYDRFKYVIHEAGNIPLPFIQTTVNGARPLKVHEAVSTLFWLTNKSISYIQNLPVINDIVKYVPDQLARELESIRNYGYIKTAIDTISPYVTNILSEIPKVEDILEVKSYCLPVSDYLGSHHDYRRYANIWDTHLKVSFNVATQAALGIYDFVAKPFDDMQKQTPYVLVKYSSSKKLWEVDMLDLDDAQFFLEHLKNHENQSVDGGYEVALYSLEEGVIQQGPGDLTNYRIDYNDKAAMLLAQTKFFNGLTDYTPIEEDQLQNWIAEKGVDKMRTLFNEIIIKHRSDRKRLSKAMDKHFVSKT
jgi:hypothetical protein